MGMKQISQALNESHSMSPLKSGACRDMTNDDDPAILCAVVSVSERSVEEHPIQGFGRDQTESRIALGSADMDLLIVEDDTVFRETCANWMVRKDHRVRQASNGQEGLQQFNERDFDVALVDMNMPGISGLELLERIRDSKIETEVIILTGNATVETAVQAMKLGASDYLTKPFPLAELEQRCQMAFERRQLRKENEQLKAVIARQAPNVKMIGNSPQLREVYRLIDRVGPTDKSALIQGDSGTGKELVARAIQQASARANRPFVVVNCAALPDQLVESEFFGHERGAFTGAAANKPGLFEVADGGTMFIDEIGELSLTLQPKLLRVLEDGSLRRVGSNRERRVDVRIIAATNRDLAEEVKAGRFREDLYYRINVMGIVLAPLCEREGDIPLLIEHFLPEGWEIEPEARQVLEHYHWPGNIREFINTIERATIMADDQTITIDDLPREMTEDPSVLDHSSDSRNLNDIERTHVLEVLQQERGNKARAARVLGIHRRKLYRLLERFSIGDEAH